MVIIFLLVICGLCIAQESITDELFVKMTPMSVCESLNLQQEWCKLYKRWDEEEIKKFHAEHGIPYNRVYLSSPLEKGLSALPLELALLENHLDFGLFLLKEKCVDVSASYEYKYPSHPMHALAEGIAQHGLQDKHKEIMQLLVKAKVDINGEESSEVPLERYVRKNESQDYNAEVFKLFFAHGACIKPADPKHIHNVLLPVIIKERIVGLLGEMIDEKKYDPMLKAKAVAMIYNERICLPYIFYFKYLSLVNKRQSEINLKISKPLIHSIVKMIIGDEFRDIHKSLSEPAGQYRDEVGCYKASGEETLLQRVTKSEVMKECPELVTLVAPQFWNEPVNFYCRYIQKILHASSNKK